MRRRARRVVLLVFTSTLMHLAALRVHAIAAAPGAAKEAKAAPPFAAWGEEVLARIDSDLKVGTLYAEWRTADGKKGNEHGQFSYVWPASFQLRALAAAAKVNPRKYGKPLVLYADSLERYFAIKYGGGGYMVLPSPSERFYDDNAWMLLGLIDAYEASGQGKCLTRATQVLIFLQNGEEKTEGGGIRQHEDKPGGLFTCTTAAAAVGALRLHIIMKHASYENASYVAFAERMYAALMSPEIGIRDPADGLFHQWARKDGDRWHVERGKRAYQSALPLQLNLLLFRVKEDEKYLLEAKRIAASAATQWIRADGCMAETGQWGGSDLCDAFLDLYEADKDGRWLEIVRHVLAFLHEKARDPNGRYGERWDVPQAASALEKCLLLHMAPVARAYWRAAAYAGK